MCLMTMRAVNEVHRTGSIHSRALLLLLLLFFLRLEVEPTVHLILVEGLVNHLYDTRSRLISPISTLRQSETRQRLDLPLAKGAVGRFFLSEPAAPGCVHADRQIRT